MIESKQIEKENLTNKSRLVLIFQIITALLYALLTIFLVCSFLDSVVFVNKDEPYVGVGIALYLVIVVIIFGGVGAILTSLLSFIGLMIGLKKRRKGFLVSNGKIIYFIVFMILPLITVAVIGILTKLLA